MKHSQKQASKGPATGSTMVPPLTPFLLAGLAMRPVPPALVQPFLTFSMRAIERRHPGLFDRMTGVAEPEFLIDPTDLPFIFLLRIDPLLPSLTAYHDAEGLEPTATIRGPLLTLVQLLEGRIDGDAMFFSRDLVIEGDTEAVVALRNAVDGAEIDVVEDVLDFLGPLGSPARMAFQVAAHLFERAAGVLETVREAFLSPVQRRAEAQAADIRGLNEKVTDLDKRAPRARARQPVRKAKTKRTETSNETEEK